MASRDAFERLADPVQVGWWLRLYEGAGEAGGCYRAPRRTARGGGGGGPAADPERAASEAGRRARTKLRRYCAANGLNRLGTLTYRGDGCHDPQQVRADVGAFFRRLRAELDAEAFPYAWVPEWHKTDHGLHLHFAVGRYISQPLIERVWGHGYVSIKMLSGCPAGATKVVQARRAAGYLTKYVAKTFAESDEYKRPKGFHRFDVAQGFAPSSLVVHGFTCADVRRQASRLMGGTPAREWNSGEVEGWQGPPAVWLQWDGSR